MQSGETLRVSPSLRWRCFALCVHVVALLSVIVATLPLWLTSALSIVILVSLMVHHQTTSFTPFDVQLGEATPKVGADGTALHAAHPESRVWGPLVLLRISGAKSPACYVLLFDSMAGPEYWACLRRYVRSGIRQSRLVTGAQD